MIDLNFQRVGDSHLLQSDSFILSAQEMEYVLEKENVIDGDIKSKIENHEVITLHPREDRRITYVFWPVPNDANQWVIDVIMHHGTKLIPIDRLMKVLSNKDPIPRSIPKTDSNQNPTQSLRSKDGATIWITYAWVDNKDQDVDFIVQELERVGLSVKIDRWNIEAGLRLWEQIAHFITNEEESDAWVLYATPNSLGSEPCKEEFSYALGRALNNRGKNYPVIGLFPGPVDNELIPPGIRSRLYVSTTDPDWKERIKAAAEGRTPNIGRPDLKPYQIRKHIVSDWIVLEFRPRAGTWYPFVVGVPQDEKKQLGGNGDLIVLPGAANNPPPTQGGFITRILRSGNVTASDGSKWWTIQPMDEVTPVKSIYLYVRALPSKILFGSSNGPQYVVDTVNGSFR